MNRIIIPLTLFGNGLGPDRGDRTESKPGGNSNSVGTYQTDELKSHRHHVVPPTSRSQMGGGKVTEGNETPNEGVSSVTDYAGGMETRTNNIYVNRIIKH